MNPNSYLPDEFLQKMASIMPAHLSMEDFISSCQKPLRKSIRVNTLKISVKDFLSRVQEKSWQLTPVPWCHEGFWIQRPENEEAAIPLGNTAEHLAGLFYIQEASSMMPPFAMLNDGMLEGERFLDVASAPGSKTTQMAAYTQGKGLIIANEFSSSRIKGLYSNILRCGIRNVALTHFDGCVFGPYLPETFDSILLDAPCSGEGTIRKDEDALKNWNQESILAIADVQKNLIRNAFHALKPGGLLVYSTCTLSHEENQDICEYLLHEFPESVSFEPLTTLFPGAEECTTKEGFLHIWPQVYDSEGFFVARIRKTEPVPLPESPTRKLGKLPFDFATKKQVSEFAQYLKQHYQLTLPIQMSLMIRGKEYWIVPNEIIPLFGRIKFDRIGLKVAEKFTKGFRMSHEFAMTFGTDCTQNIYNLSTEEFKVVYQGKDVPLQSTTQKQGEVILMYDNHPVGIGKWQKSRIKNNLPRELVRDQRLIT
ncbi:16S rRNA (cytosine(1407)-C(5))-methyltransferase RsmF [Algicola sagamiensis]|uniref:16S rRNA (cytosine(1407)-C(5))-methyltransferase RsmF n=1 Tax=Algicola sagamiensis TaxID=163869 RepID=UPI0003A51CCE|nr:16S rRNA (cytosine(1407)-C(5))-methyltransferase RsmF [Algicola sagamiensis]